MRRAIKTMIAVARGERNPLDPVGGVLPAVRRVPAEGLLQPGAPSVVLSPHLDDAVLSCWSVLAAPEDRAVVNVFAGVPPEGKLDWWDRVTGGSDSAAVMTERLEEDRRALSLVGREPVNLPFLQAPYRRMAPSVRTVLRALLEEVPAVSCVHAPVAIGGHPDHVLVRTVGFELARRGVPLRLYAELPYAVKYGWPHWVSSSDRHPKLDVDAYWEPYVASAPCGLSALERAVHVLSEDEMAAKLKALRTYGTQFPALDAGDRSFVSDPRVLRYEVSWAVRVKPGRKARPPRPAG